MIDMEGQQDFIPYLQSMTNELNSTRDRVRNLVAHWATDGHFKESLLRQFLRRHLPESVMVGTGFVVNALQASGEIDVLIVDRNMPTLFKEGNLLIVTPESVKAVVEVKTRLGSPAEITDAVRQIAARKAIVTAHVQCRDVWAGLFVFYGDDDRHEAILNSLYEVRRELHTTVDFVAYGNDTVVKFFDLPAEEGGPWPDHAWHSFHMPGVAPSNFVASLIEQVVPQRRDPGSFAWFRPPDEFERRFVIEDKRDAVVTKYDQWINAHPNRPLPFGNTAGPTSEDDAP